MTAPFNSSANQESPEPINRRKLLGKAAAATLGLAAGAVARQAFSKPPGQALVGELPGPVGQAVRRVSSGPTYLKQQSQEDYQANMQEFGGSLSSPLQTLLAIQPMHGPYQVDILVIGSGYGAAVCAARLAQKMRPDVRLAILERGREWKPGTFPDNRTSVSEEARFDPTSLVKNRIRNPLGLFSAARFDEVNVLSGNGLGGGSLINANVAYRPQADTFATERWPTALQDGNELAPFYDRALYELNPGYEPYGETPKSGIMFASAGRFAALGGRIEPANLTITRGSSDLPIYNRQGLRQRACIDCGDCNTGCNVGAKNSLALNYLPLARRHGARIFTQCEAMSIEPCGGYYRVHFKHYPGGGIDPEFHTRQSVTARIIVLGAGSIGSTELLLRSQADHNLSLSSALGRRWSANGDAIGFISNINNFTNIAGYGTHAAPQKTVGPTIQTNLTFPDRETASRILIQDGTVARAYTNVLGLVLRDLNFDSTMVLFAMGFDDGAGQITLDSQGRGYVRWPGLEKSAYRQRVQREFARVGAALGGNYHVLRAFGSNMVTVHPLGGCNMSDDPDRGVTTDHGQIWFPHGSSAVGRPMVHGGLYVADGAILPAPIGVNPFLTICALSERIAQSITTDPQYGDLFVT